MNLDFDLFGNLSIGPFGRIGDRMNISTIEFWRISALHLLNENVALQIFPCISTIDATQFHSPILNRKSRSQ